MAISIGEKIKIFRKRAKLSQLELEERINASFGSLSKIENGETNPTKETLLKIIETLGLNSYEAASLFNIPVEKDITKMIQLSNHLNVLDLDQVIRNFVDELVLELNIISALIWINDNGILKTTPFTKTWYTELVTKMLPVPLSSIIINLSDQKFDKNIISNAAKDMNIYSSESFTDFGESLLPKQILLAVERLLGIKISVAIPIISENKCLGVLTASWGSIDKFERDKGIIEAFANHLAITMANINKYKELEDKLNKIEKKKQG